jgi:hypothetical protein
MGSAFSTCTFNEAAKILSKSKRSIYIYVKNGFIRKTYSPELGQTLLIKEDVEQLKKDKGIGLPPINHNTVYELLNRVTKLEEDMAVVRTILDITSEPLRLPPTNAIFLYTEASVSFRDRLNKWSLEEIQTWINLLQRMDVKTLEVIGSAASTDTPWQPFYELCVAMVDHCKSSHLTEVTKLEGCKSNLNKNIHLWLEMGKGRLPKEALKPLTTQKEALLRRLAARSANKGKP